MSEMIERVAKAIEEADANGFSKLPYWECAKVAIEAMREPTSEMIKEGESEFFEFRPSPQDWTLASTKNCWQAMIDEALK